MNRAITAATSTGPCADGRAPGSTTSITSISSIRRRNGRRLRRSRIAFATIVSTRPASSTATSKFVTFRLTVTGVKIRSATDSARMAALTASTRT